MAALRHVCSACEEHGFMTLDIGGVETIQVPGEAVWRAVNDPLVLTRCIPGCKTMTEIAPDAYKVEMQLRVAAVGGSFEGEIALSDKEAPKACSIKVSGAGTLGHGNRSARLQIEPEGPGASRLAFQGGGGIGGLVAGVGQRIFSSGSKHLVRRVSAWRQRLVADGRPCRYPRRQGDLSFQSVRLLGNGRHLPARDQDAAGSGGQGPRRGKGHHQLCDVRLVRPATGRRHRKIFGDQYRDPRPDRLCRSRSRGGRANLGAGLYHAAVEEERYANDRYRHCRELEEIHRQPQHSLSRRRRPYRLGGKEPKAGCKTLRRLQGSLGMGNGASRGGVEADRAQGATIRRRLPNSFAPMTGSA